MSTSSEPSRTPVTTIPTVNISPFTNPASTDAERLGAGQALVAALHRLGFAKITGHGLAGQEMDDAFAWVKRLFDLPVEDKMKAPHPAAPMPHRGYSGLGSEKVYSMEDLESQVAGGKPEQELRKVEDFKESYEVGSEDDDQQPNIWLPDEVLPGFRDYTTSLYQRLSGVANAILDAIGVGLRLDAHDLAALRQMACYRYCQLRLLHYPAITKQKLQKDVFARMPAHNDWGTFTMLMQDSNGGLELRDPQSQQFLQGSPENGVLILNAGDMLQRFTNGYFISALHRVSVPNPDAVSEAGIPARYSIPFFVAPAPSHTVASLARFVSAETPAKYEPVKFEDYSSVISKYMYRSEKA
ncbi:Leucoanthocyanidin dioxygenase [Madurella fahalii]|uniref:Leucoanthocyanidin dioxygenase n=1 Tax=Madurella fahalii TaxID=1157608 RepID=A0ABQ0G3X2_9PEZI